MPSQRQLDANRKNAARGGPKTEKGRAAVRLNALKHGLCAATAVLPGEDQAALDQLRQDLRDEYGPAGAKMELLFNHFVACSWRLLRFRRVETEMWTAYIFALRKSKGAEGPVTQAESDKALAGALTESSVSTFTNFFRYHRMNTRDFYTAMAKLDEAQEERRRHDRARAERQEREAADRESDEFWAEEDRRQAKAERAEADESYPLSELSANGIGIVSSTKPQPAVRPSTPTPVPRKPAPLSTSDSPGREAA